MIGICLRIFILHLALVFCFSGPVFAVMAENSHSAPPEPGQKQTTTVFHSDREVVNIVIDRIEDGYIYSKTGEAYQIGSAKVINNSSSQSKIKIAELTFQKGTLVVVVLK